MSRLSLVERERRENCLDLYTKITWDNWDEDESPHERIMNIHKRAGVYTKYAEAHPQEDG